MLTVASTARVQHTVVWELDEHDVVKQILARCKAYDATAQQLQRHAHTLEATVLGLGVFVTFLSLFNEDVGTSGGLHDVIHWTLVVLPVFVAALIALVGVTGSGKRWLLVRGACEAIKHEIFVWRTRTGVYAPAVFAGVATGPADATEQLVDRVASIEAQLMGSIVGSSTAFAPVDDGHIGVSDGDDGISRLAPDDYLRVRVADQLAYYRRKVTSLAPRLRRYQLAWIVAGAAGSILAAAGASVWIGLTVAVAGAIGAHMKQVQLDTTLVGFNRGIAGLQECLTRWGAVPVERRTDARFELLVSDAEHALETEQSTWLKQMKVGLDSLLPAHEELEKTTLTAPSSLDGDLPSYDPPSVAPAPAPAPAPPRCGKRVSAQEPKRRSAPASTTVIAPLSGCDDVLRVERSERPSDRRSRRTDETGDLVLGELHLHGPAVDRSLLEREVAEESRDPRLGVVGAEFDSAPVTLAETPHQHADQREGSPRSASDESPELGRGQHPDGEPVEGDRAGGAGAAVERSQFADQRAGPANAEHRLGAVVGRHEDLQATPDDHEHEVALLALVEHVGAARVRPRAADREERSAIVGGELVLDAERSFSGHPDDGTALQRG